MWNSPEERLALLELLSRGTLKRRRAQSRAFDALAELPWTRATARRDELGLVEDRQSELVVLLERVWPTWGEGLADLAGTAFHPRRMVGASSSTRAEPRASPSFPGGSTGARPWRSPRPIPRPRSRRPCVRGSGRPRRPTMARCACARLPGSRRGLAMGTST